MKLQELLDKIVNVNFLLTVDGFCDQLPFWRFDTQKEEFDWVYFKDRVVKNIQILEVDGMPELWISLYGGAGMKKEVLE